MKSSDIFLLLLISSQRFIADQDVQCSSRDSCSNSTSIPPSIYGSEEFIRSRNCFCDPVCKQYGDCCQSSSSTYETNQYECVDFLSPVLTDEPPRAASLFVWMRTRCLPIYIGSPADLHCRNLHNKTFQQDPLLFIPITSVHTNVTYRNYFCAYCNNEMDSYVRSWEYRAVRRENTSTHEQVTIHQTEEVRYYIQNLTQNWKKTIIYPHTGDTSQPAVFIRPCKKSLPRTCPPETADTLARNCSSAGIAYRYDLSSNATYPNPYCAECHRQAHSQITCADPFLRSGLLVTFQKLVHSLSVLFDPTLLKRYAQAGMHDNFTKEMIYSMSYTCPKPHEVYHLFKQQCLPVPHLQKYTTVSLNCTHPVLTAGKHFRWHNGSVHLTHSAIRLTPDQYILLNAHQILFCADRWPKAIPQLSIYRHISSTICTSVSLGCLVLFLILFCFIPSLQNLPGKCLLCLSIALLIGQLTFLCASQLTHRSSLCLAAAIVIHYFYLSSFFWLLIIAAHVHSTFHHDHIHQQRTRSENSYLFAYNILAWCATGMIVLVACLLQLIHPQSSFSPRYGEPFCSISQPNAMIAFFLLPIGCLLVMVTILFVKTILAIYRSHTVARFANTSSTNSFALIYARLASLMGLQWVLLISALIIGQNWMWILFEIVNSLPGVFICFGFVCSQRLCSGMKESITTRLFKRREPTGSHTTSTSTMPATTQR